MHTRKLWFSLACVGLLIAAMAPAVRADDPPAEQKPAAPATQPAGAGQFPMLARIRSAVDELKLRDEQKTKIDKLFQDAKMQLQEARDAAKGDRQEIARESRQVIATLRGDLMAALDEGQKVELRAKLRALATGRNGGDAIGRLRTALESLNLGGDQKRDIKQALDSAEKKAKDLRDQIQAGDQDAREKLMSLMRETRKTISDILTEHQKQQLQDALQQPGRQQRPATGDSQ